MQCRGKTRSGQRCRNRSLVGELFCDIHMRVNHSYNLALLIPLLTALLVGYFFFFGLLFETVIFGVFDINYLKYAGMEDLFLNMLRFGSMITLILLIVWLLYAILLSFFFTVWLMVRMIEATKAPSLSLANRVKTIGLSMLIFLFNILLLFVVLVPARHRRRADKFSVRRENFARALLHLKDTAGHPQPGRPVVTARAAFADYLYFRNAGNHRFFFSILLLFIITLGVTYHAGGKAEYARACTLLNSDSVKPAPAPELPFAAFVLEAPCLLTGEEQPAEASGLTAKFTSAITNFFEFTPITVQAADSQTSFLHLATTSRFDLFFNGANGRSLVIPRGAFAAIHDDQRREDTLASLPMPAPVPAPSSSVIEKQLDQLENQLNKSNQALYGLGSDLKKTNERLSEMDRMAREVRAARKQFEIAAAAALAKKKPIKPIQNIPQQNPILLACWNVQPDYIIPFIKASHIITDAEILDQLVRLSLRYRRFPEQMLAIIGYADPDGSQNFNLEISNKRARHVSQLLEKLGVNRHRLRTVGMGENEDMTRPQRRVEIRNCTRR